MKKTTFRNTLWKAKRIAIGVSMLFAFGAGTLFASDTSGMPDWQTPTAQGSFDSDGAGKISFAFSDSGGTKTGPGGSAIYTFSVPKGNFISISVSADDSADVQVPAANVSASSHWDADLKRIIPGEAKSAFVDIEDITAETFPVTIDYSNAGGPYVLSFTVFVERVKAEVETVNISATSKLTLSQDDGTAFDGSDWVKGRSRNGETREANPISVTSGNALKFIPTFRIKAETPPSKVRAEFTVPGATVPAQIKSYSSISSGFEIPAPVASGQINYFDNTLRITWSVQYDGCEKWFPAGTSSHEIYFTRAAPQTNLRQETLFWVSCAGGRGKVAEVDVVDGIYGIFQTKSIGRKSDNLVMKYWKNWEQGARTTSGLFASVDGNGNCEAWSAFLRDAVKLQGIQAHRMKVFSRRSTVIRGNTEYVMVKTWNFGTSSETHKKVVFWSGTSETSEEEYTHVANEAATVVAPGIAVPGAIMAGQGNSNTPPSFNGHWITMSCGYYYDPSYGSNKVSTANGADYENSAFSGFYTNDSDSYGRINPVGLDVTYTLDD